MTICQTAEQCTHNLNKKSIYITSEAMQYRQAMCRIPTVSLNDYTVHPLKQNFNIGTVQKCKLNYLKITKIFDFFLNLPL